MLTSNQFTCIHVGLCFKLLNISPLVHFKFPEIFITFNQLISKLFRGLCIDIIMLLVHLCVTQKSKWTIAVVEVIGNKCGLVL